MLALLLLLALPGPARAYGPIVCLTGQGDQTVYYYDLSNCGVPAGTPAYVELIAYPYPEFLTNGGPIRLAMGDSSGQYCQVRADKGSNFSCAVMVYDNILDVFLVSGDPQHYRLVAFPISSSSEEPTAPALIEPSYSVYTTTLPSGDVVTVERRTTYGELYIVTLLVFVVLMSVLGIIVIAVRFKG